MSKLLSWVSGVPVEMALASVLILGSCSAGSVAGLSPASTTAPTTSTSPPKTEPPAAATTTASVEPIVVLDGLGRTLNLGAVFEVPLGEDWGVPLELVDIDQIAEVGFTAIRIPVRWADWASNEPPYEIDPEIHRRVDEVVDRALASGMAVVLDLHHYEEMASDPEGQKDRFLAIWRQIGEHNAGLADSVVFELINEPNGRLEGDLLNEIIADGVAAIRESNPERTIIVGPGEFYSPVRLDVLELPEDDNLMVTVHYYDPFEFTHQGASWVEGSDAWTGTSWGGEDDMATIQEELDSIESWANEAGIEVFVGEFGVVSTADREARLAWFSTLVEEVEARGFAWAYWDWATGNFGAYDIARQEWDEEVLDALLGPAG